MERFLLALDLQGALIQRILLAPRDLRRQVRRLLHRALGQQDLQDPLRFRIVLVAGGATLEQAQDHIEEQVEWFTDQFYDGLTPEEAAKEALA